MAGGKLSATTIDATYSCRVRHQHFVDLGTSVTLPPADNRPQPGVLVLTTGVKTVTGNGVTITVSQVGLSAAKNSLKIDKASCPRMKRRIPLKPKGLSTPPITVTPTLFGHDSEQCGTAARVLVRLRLRLTLTNHAPSRALLAIRNDNAHRAGDSTIPPVREVATGLWHWQAPHPEWDDSVWPEVVSSYAIDDGERLLLFDPIAPPDELPAEARELVVVLTNPWHERDTRVLVEKRNPPVFCTDPGEGSPDLEWLVSGEAGDPHLYSADGGLPPGVEAAFPGREPNDVVLWVPGRRAVIAGDTLVDFGDGLTIHEPWLSTTREQVVEQLRPLLNLPVEHVLATHGGPHDRAALQRALA